MAKGSESKELVIKAIREMYPQAFIYGKELRIPFEENGERVEIKVALTCAKSNVGGDDASVESGEQPQPVSNAPAAEPTDDEKRNIADLMERLGF